MICPVCTTPRCPVCTEPYLGFTIEKRRGTIYFHSSDGDYCLVPEVPKL